jgi:hypothetical protein
VSNCDPSHIPMIKLDTWYSRRPSPPLKDKTTKLAVIIVLHKGVVSVSPFH